MPYGPLSPWVWEGLTGKLLENPIRTTAWKCPTKGSTASSTSACGSLRSSRERPTRGTSPCSSWVLKSCLPLPYGSSISEEQPFKSLLYEIDILLALRVQARK